jgi:alkylhydroperoxidase/carboxymuconolactone decarboxylase family protein
MSLDPRNIRTTLELARRHRLLTEAEASQIEGALSPGFPFQDASRLAGSLHAHVKVESLRLLPDAALRDAGGVVENEKAGYVKYAFASGLNLIFSSIDISEDDLRDGGARLPRPFLDHFGIDLRQETADVRALFDSVPKRATELGWGLASQGTEERPVFCCHTSVARKHWVYPSTGTPIELAFGALVIHADKSGCDLRPLDPRLGLPPAACGGKAHAALEEPRGTYYAPADLARFSEVGANRGELMEKFFAWYGAVFAEGALTAREKSLIALAVAHTVQCPYCIDAYTHDAGKKGASLDQMTEAVHVAAAIRGGASLVHGVQMRTHARGHG